jgi:hypothetical protein
MKTILTLIALLITVQAVSAQAPLSWQNIHPQAGWSKKVKSHFSGNAFVAGTVNTGSGTSFYLSKINSSGTTLWTKTYTGPSTVNILSDMEIDLSSNIYITGMSLGQNTGFDYATLKYDADGNLLWANRFNSPGNKSEIPYDMEIGNDGRVFVTGSSQFASDTSEILTAVYYTDGSLSSLMYFNSPGGRMGQGLRIKKDDFGCLYVAGTLRQSNGTNDIVLIRYSEAGAYMWHRTYNSNFDNNESPMAITTLSSMVTVTGSFYQPGYGTNMLTLQFDYQGGFRWVRSVYGAGDGDDTGNDIVMDGQYNTYVAGKTKNSNGDYDCALLKYSVTGSLIYGVSFDGAAHKDDEGTDMEMDGLENIYIAGSSKNSSSDMDGLLIKFSSNGSILWNKTFNYASGLNDFFTTVSEQNGKIYTAGNTGTSSATLPLVVKYTEALTGINPAGNETAEGYSLSQNYPNPFNPVTNLEFSIAASGFVSVKIYDISGREVRTMVNQNLEAGIHKYTFDASGLNSGVYFYTLQAGGYKETKKMLLVK